MIDVLFLCQAAFLGIEGGPYTECETRLDYENDNECGTLYCKGASGTCSSLTYSDGLVTQVQDGIPCNVENEGYQCFEGTIKPDNPNNPNNFDNPDNSDFKVSVLKVLI